MTTLPDQSGELERLEALREYAILDSGAEQVFDDIVLLAKQLCKTPIALISFVGSDRQWFKASQGLDVGETPIGQSVCAHALRQSDTLIIPDLTLDVRTRDNTLVTQAPSIRFYAGALLRSRTNVPIGTVCVIDTVSRAQGLTAEQLAGLEALARQTMMLLEMRRALVAGETRAAAQHSTNSLAVARAVESERISELLRLNDLRLRMAQEAGQVGSFDVNLATDIVTVTDEFCRIFGLAAVDRIAAAEVEKLIHPDDFAVMSSRDKRKSGPMPLAVEYRIRKADTGAIVWIARRAQFIESDDGTRLRMLGTVQDITERREAEERQSLLNVELSHRLKNTLALVQAIATQTLRGSADKSAVRAFEQRVDALSRAHDVLLQQNWSSADMRDVMNGVLGLHGDVARFRLSGPKVMFGSKAALTLSLLLHELATNAIKYGALSVPQGHVEATWRVEGADLHFAWKEVGGPAAQPPTRVGLGSRLIDMGLAGTGGVSKRYALTGFEVDFVSPLASVREV